MNDDQKNPISLENGWEPTIPPPLSVGRDPYRSLKRLECKRVYTTVSTGDGGFQKIPIGCIGPADNGQMLFRLGPPPEGVKVID